MLMIGHGSDNWNGVVKIIRWIARGDCQIRYCLVFQDVKRRDEKEQGAKGLKEARQEQGVLEAPEFNVVIFGREATLSLENQWKASMKHSYS